MTDKRKKIKFEDFMEIMTRATAVQTNGLGGVSYFGKPIRAEDIPALVILDLKKMGLLNHARIELGK